MGADKDVQEETATAQLSASEEALRAAMDQVDAAQRELQAADEARKAREDELTRAAEELDHTIGQSIEACAAERDALKEQMHAVEERMHELEAMRSRHRLERLGGGAVAGVEAPAAPAAEGGEVPENAEGTPTAGPDGAYEDGWYEILKQQKAEGGETADGEAEATADN